MAETGAEQPKHSPAELAGAAPTDQPGPVFDSIALLNQYDQIKLAQTRPTSVPEDSKPAPVPTDAKGQVCPPSPEYNKYLDYAARYIYDPKDLGDIAGLQHKYDCDIKSTDDVFKYANQSLAVSGDRFNHAMPPAEAKEFERMQRGAYSGIGLEIVPSQILGAPNPAARVAGDHPAGATVIKSVVPGKPAEAAGLQPGDAFMKIDGEDVHTKSPADISDLITSGQPGTKVDIVVDRQGHEEEKIAVRQKLTSPPVVHDKDLGNGIAYIQIDNFGSETEASQLAFAMDKHKTAKAFVIDVRDNPGGLVDQALLSAELFVKDGTLMTSRQRHDSPPEKPVYDEKAAVVDKNGLTTTSKKSDDGSTSVNYETRMPYKAAGRPVVVLTNGNSASASEIFTGAVHDSGHDTVIGTTTYGKGIGQNIIKNMPDGGYLKVTTLHYLTPSGIWPGDADKHKIGLHPDISAVNLEGIVKGSALDTQLSTAVDYLKQKLNGK